MKRNCRLGFLSAAVAGLGLYFISSFAFQPLPSKALPYGIPDPKDIKGAIECGKEVAKACDKACSKSKDKKKCNQEGDNKCNQRCTGTTCI